ncbi:MAG TPA: ABC transporter ATP-binding protein, partial [Sporichthya sp.]|nr:ABC transporter ATP-binding protein [Sporichthya sp.]
MTAPARGPAPPGARPPGPAQHAALLAMPVEKSLHFQASSKRLLGMMRPERALVLIAVALGALSVSLSVLGPFLLGKATDVIVGGVVTKDLPANLTNDQVVAELEKSGRGELADLVRHVDATPGQGVDFTRLGHVLLLALSVYALGALFSLLQGRLVASIVQRL